MLNFKKQSTDCDCDSLSSLSWKGMSADILETGNLKSGQIKSKFVAQLKTSKDKWKICLIQYKNSKAFFTTPTASNS